MQTVVPETSGELQVGQGDGGTPVFLRPGQGHKDRGDNADWFPVFLRLKRANRLISPATFSAPAASAAATRLDSPLKQLDWRAEAAAQMFAC